MTGFFAFSLVAPLQILMLQTAKGAEVLASAAMQASFNIGNALGAFLGGLPLIAGYDFATPNLVGVGMSLVGAALVIIFIKCNSYKII